ncbi:hypothetical protein AB7M16_003009 [Bradyrhizobium sp. USDA 372]
MAEKRDFQISRPQLKDLVQRAGKGAVEAALIQNGSAPDEKAAFTLSPAQLKKLIEHAGPEVVERALIQNGSAPTD